MWLPDSSILIPEAHGLVDYSDPVNWSHPLNRGLVAWYLALPDWMGGNTWFDLCRRHHGTLTNMTPSTAWQASSRPGGWGQLAFDGSDDHCVLDGSIVLSLPVSFEAVVSTPSTAAFQRIAHMAPKDVPYAGVWFQINNGGAVEIGFGDGQGPTSGNRRSLISTSTVSANRTYHLAATVTGSTSARITIDGNDAGLTTGGTGGALDTGTASSVIAALRLSNTVHHGNIALQSLKVWSSRELSITDARDLYNLSRQHYPGLLNRVQLPYYAPQAGGYIDNTSPILRHIMGAC